MHIRTPRVLSPLMLAFLVLQIMSSGVLARNAEGNHQESDGSLTREIIIPLDQGELDVGELLGAILDEIGLDGRVARKQINWSIDVNGMLGQGPIKAIESATNDVLTIETRDDAVAIRFDRLRMDREEQKIRENIRHVMQYWFPDAAAELRADYGFTVYMMNQAGVEAAHFDFAKSSGEGREFVILVHGLDEPGHIWNQLQPALVDRGYLVCEFWYPNDQAILRSANFFADELRGLRAQGLKKASIVAHSMGGLVTREVLTNPKWYAGDAGGGDEYPAIERFIMVGTPNHGAPMARLHFAGEIREQIIRSFSGDGMLFDGFFDGAGEAKIDLLPDSEFLTALNSRPLPANLKISIIAGKASPIERGEVQSVIERIAPSLPTGAGESMDQLADDLVELTEGFGDGAVSIESTKLEGVVDHNIVPGNHITMIRNHHFHDEDRIPPAIPIILDRLSHR